MCKQESENNMTQEERRTFLIQRLLDEQPRYKEIRIPRDISEQKQMLRALFNIRSPEIISEDFLAVQDAYLREETAAKGITDIADLTPVEDGIYLWRGDITTLKCGAIVNAANSGITGCYVPCHSCIDNCIHTYAGVQLRLECARQMSEQGHEEETGKAKITPAYNLPCDYVIHTVGPIVDGDLTPEHCELLRSCYNSCLEIAVQNNIKSIAFCCISTGVFGFPQNEAAEIAVNTIRKFLTNHNIEVAFNVFTEKD